MKLKCAKHNRLLAVDEAEGDIGYVLICPSKEHTIEDFCIIVSDLKNPELINGEVLEL